MPQNQVFGRALLMGCDVSGYGSGDDQLQVAMQEGLISVLDEAATGARLVRSEWDRNSTGDGELAMLPASQSEPRVVDAFIRELDAALARHNRHLADQARLRLRVAIHYGVAYPASNGYAGQGVVVVSRLLDSAPVREAIQQSGTELALILSDSVYSETVLNGHTSLRPRDFRKVAVRNKEFAAHAWIWLPHGDVHRLVLASQETSGDGPGPVAERPVATGGTQPSAPAPAVARTGAEERGAARASASNEFYGLVYAPRSVFGNDLSGR